MMLKKILSIFLIFNLITVSTAQAASTTATTFVDSLSVQVLKTQYARRNSI